MSFVISISTPFLSSGSFIPFEPNVFGISLNVHMILEYLAFFLAFRYYVFLRRRNGDSIEKITRLNIIIGATLGAFLGSRFMGFLENPVVVITAENIAALLQNKTIMGGLFGGLLGVEISKKIIGETQSSGDLFTLPIVFGIFIGRIGCFLSGTKEFTYGSETTFFTGMNLGDGVLRHPTSLYELIFLILLFFILKYISKAQILKSGDLFKIFMLLYFGFRFFIEFIKPNSFYLLGLSSIQFLCIICWIYYSKFLFSPIRNAY